MRAKIAAKGVKIWWIMYATPPFLSSVKEFFHRSIHGLRINIAIEIASMASPNAVRINIKIAKINSELNGV
jgi:hypothetical protein